MFQMGNMYLFSGALGRFLGETTPIPDLDIPKHGQKAKMTPEVGNEVFG